MIEKILLFFFFCFFYWFSLDLYIFKNYFKSYVHFSWSKIKSIQFFLFVCSFLILHPFEIYLHFLKYHYLYFTVRRDNKAPAAISSCSVASSYTLICPFSHILPLLSHAHPSHTFSLQTLGVKLPSMILLY